MRSARWLVMALLVLAGSVGSARGATVDDRVRAYLAAHLTNKAMMAKAVPSFARQTGLACSACHYQFLQLTPFGRKFKLNGYTLAAQPSITETDSTTGGRLDLGPAAIVSAMLTAAVTHLSDTLPGKIGRAHV